MGKRKWRRVRLADLATQEEQDRILNLISQASPEENQAQKPHKNPQDEPEAVEARLFY
jgi:hypothetical protein